MDSPCHGDLTLQNILVQDVEVMWSFRENKRNDSDQIIRLAIMRDLILDTINNMYMGASP